MKATCKWMIIIFVVSNSLFAWAQRKNKLDFYPINNKIQSWIDSGYYNGTSIIIARKNQVVFEKYYGNFNLDTVIYIASAGKWLASAALAAVVDEGKLSWDDPVKKWIPSFTDLKGEATLRQLFSHTAGYLTYQPKENPVDKYQTLEESVAHILPLPIETYPGTQFNYGGLAMQVAGRMAEIATGKSWEEIFQEKIAKPLGMLNTHFTPVSSIGGHSPMLGGGARTTLKDYTKFLQMFANNGNFNGKQVLSKNAIKEIEANQVLKASVKSLEYVERVRSATHKGIYGLGVWREELDENNQATLISSPSWAGAYPWIDKTTHTYGFFLARVDHMKNGFMPFYASPVLPVLMRDVIKTSTQRKSKK
jgi:CubicO group peptidase (beta-lactamase class C family)